MGSEPRLTAFLLPQETFHYQINIEKSPPPMQQHHALTLSGWVAELEGSKCWAQVGSCRPRETEAQAPRAGWGMGREGHGQPCYCWQEVAPFFPDGETEAQGGLGTCPRSLTVSQLFRG